mmetsp:Transcript_105914/g.129211  ORF Transcript_105914/g.129211 Transcript_105914/m.129211 type:complete len:720 (-) Transcript_105914:58-2217(-)
METKEEVNNNDTNDKYGLISVEQLCQITTCNLNQFAMDFDGNLDRIIESVKIAKKLGGKLRCGPELEITGYGCEDHFLEQDIFLHSWQSIYYIIKSNVTMDILCCFGMPINHKSVVYNCFVWILNNKILLIRPKLFLANDGNYREMRYFASWNDIYKKDEYLLPPIIQNITNQKYIPFGALILELNDCSIAIELCEELFTPNSPHILYALNGVDIYCNGSGSHHNLRKLNQRIELITNASKRCGGVYLYSNQQGCDGNRLYYDGCALIVNNGECLAQGTQFSIHDIEVISAVVDLSKVKKQRYVPSTADQAKKVRKIPVVKVDWNLCDNSGALIPTKEHIIQYCKFEEEIALGPSYWLWDYLRRSGASGYFLPLSGGADSSSTATLVGIMCINVMKAINDGNINVKNDVKRILGIKNDEYNMPKNAKELCNKIFHTTYMGTKNSSKETRNRAKELAKDIGSYHKDVNIDSIVDALILLFKVITGKIPKFKVHGGSHSENLALQNIQARLRMVLSYFLAQLLPWIRGNKGFLLVLGSANVDEALRGYFTKYDCSAADINPIGGICKNDLKAFLKYASEYYDFKSLNSVINAEPTAELEPITNEYKQTDEIDMGMTYDELGIYGKLRNIHKCGPVSMYQKLVNIWNDKSPNDVANKVKYFFRQYGYNRHKLTTLTPSYHAENYSPDDNRFDHRQFLYPNWKRQFDTIDVLVERDTKYRKPK